ncbi:MliC family protein [Marinobacter litoralis]|uniref:MliC family protein n=1 Tax=Marinobacter litoralis TaxID=187981 RepID=UPI0018EB8CBE|nr:MliC family protein [Marinobacter litoralis]MBJ6138140.1 MliC family protein [Marinobacter litoralis]
MKFFVSVALSSVFLLSACSGFQQGDAFAKRYECESGERVAVNYEAPDSAAVYYQGTRYDMDIAASASGARYVGGGVEWWVKGSGPDSEGLLLKHRAGGSSGDIIESCSAL